MSFEIVSIGQCVSSVKNWNPQIEIPDEEFEYIDLSSIDKESKIISETSIVRLLGRDAPSRARQLINVGDVLVATVRPNLNGVALVRKKYRNSTASTGYCVLRAKSNLNAKYLYYWVQTSSFIDDMVRKSIGANYPAVSDKIVKESKIPLPPLAIQKKIASILDAADAYRQKTKALLDKYDQLAQSLFLEMFGDPVRNPKGWKKIEFQEIFELIKYGTSTPPEYTPEGIPFIRATNVKNGTVSLKGMVYISNIEAQKIKKCKLDEGDLIIVRSGANTGDCCRIPKQYNGAYGGFDIIIKIKNPYSIFYNFLLNMSAGRAIIKPLTRRAGQPHLNSKQISELNLICPPDTLQNQFAERARMIEEQKQQVQASLQKAEALFQSLLQRAFRGELVNE